MSKASKRTRGKSPSGQTTATRTKTQTAKRTEAPTSGTRENSKLAGLIAMLRRREGATIEQMVKVTGWQAHSVRGAISGALKKKLGLAVASAKVDGIRTYRISSDSSA